jgi:hypothetical protein
MRAITRDAKSGHVIYIYTRRAHVFRASNPPHPVAIMSEAPLSESPANQETRMPTVTKAGPNCVILRCRVSDFDKPFQWYAYSTAVEAFLRWAGRSVADYEEKKHNVFVELLQDPEVGQTKSNMIVDFYSLFLRCPELG